MTTDPMRPYEHLNRAAELLRDVEAARTKYGRDQAHTRDDVALAACHIALAQAQMTGREPRP